MPSTYSTSLKIELMATGENASTWGTITNTNLGTALEQAIVGLGAVSYPSDANLTISITNSNAAQAARALVLNVTSAVSLTATRELVVPSEQKPYVVQNNTSGAQSITVKTAAGTGITVPNGRKAQLYVDGVNVIQMSDFVDINGGAIDGTPIGASSPSTGAFTSLTATGINSTPIGASTASTGAFTTMTATTYNGLSLTANATGFSVAGGTTSKSLTVSNNLTFSGTDGSTLNIGTGGTLGTGAYATIANYATLASPTFTGVPAAPTAAADTNTTQLATTAYVIGQAASATPLVNGTAAVGTSLRYARGDHVHGTDTTRAPLASPTFTGVPAAPTAAVDTNTTQLATTAYVVGQGYLKSATASSTYLPLAGGTMTGNIGGTAYSIGIGIASPSYPLHVSGSTVATAKAVVESTGTTSSIAPSLAFLRSSTASRPTSFAGVLNFQDTATDATITACSITAAGDNSAKTLSLYYRAATSHIWEIGATTVATVDSSGNLTMATGSIREKQTAIAASDINLSLGNYFSRTISGATTFTVSNTPASGTAASFILDLTNGGSAAITWWANVKWAGGTAPTLTAAGRDVLGFFTYNNGTTWTGLVLGKDVK